jgi:hypothetical protein
MDPRIGNIPAGMPLGTEIILPTDPRREMPQGDAQAEFTKALNKSYGAPHSATTISKREAADDLSGLTGLDRVHALIRKAHNDSGAWQPGVIDADDQAILKAARANVGHDEEVVESFTESGERRFRIQKVQR